MICVLLVRNRTDLPTVAGVLSVWRCFATKIYHAVYSYANFLAFVGSKHVSCCENVACQFI